MNDHDEVSRLGDVVIRLADRLIGFTDEQCNGDVDKAAKFITMALSAYVISHQLEDHRLSVEHPKLLERLEGLMERVAREHESEHEGREE